LQVTNTIKLNTDATLGESSIDHCLAIERRCIIAALMIIL
jgi:hypothetical protein